MSQDEFRAAMRDLIEEYISEAENLEDEPFEACPDRLKDFAIYFNESHGETA